MGAGKTTFIHHLCDLLKVEDVVSSPTFALINEYHFNDKGSDRTIYHMDWYRLKDAEEAINAGMEDCLLQKENYSFIEWPEKALQIIPKPYLWIAIHAISAEERNMTIEIRE
jgi:tRNA threonylcarbamoyladenosine biosynthesis protein TsaE